MLILQDFQVLGLMEQLLSHTWILGAQAVGHLTCQITSRHYLFHLTAHLTRQTASGICSTKQIFFFTSYIIAVIRVKLLG
jgi:hypothetical protein